MIIRKSHPREQYVLALPLMEKHRDTLPKSKPHAPDHVGASTSIIRNDHAHCTGGPVVFLAADQLSTREHTCRHQAGQLAGIFRRGFSARSWSYISACFKPPKSRDSPAEQTHGRPGRQTSRQPDQPLLSLPYFQPSLRHLERAPALRTLTLTVTTAAHPHPKTASPVRNINRPAPPLPPPTSFYLLPPPPPHFSRNEPTSQT